MGFFVLKIVIKYLAFWFAYEWNAFLVAGNSLVRISALGADGGVSLRP